MITALILNTFFLFCPLERPTIVVAQSAIESNHKVNAKGKAGEKGAFQVIESDWGKVPKTWKKQAEQNESILNDLLVDNKGNVNKAVTSYNGKGSKAKKYLARVRRKAINIYILDIA